MMNDTETTLTALGWLLTYAASCGISFWQCLQVEDQNTRSVGRPFGERPVKVTSRWLVTSLRVNSGAQWLNISFAG